MNRDPWAWRIDSGDSWSARTHYALVMIDEDGIRQRWESIGCKLGERDRRLWAAAEVRSAGYGGLAVVSAITGIARSTINRGEDDLDAGPLPDGRASNTGSTAFAMSAAMLTAASRLTSTGVRPSEDRNSAFIAAETVMNTSAATSTATWMRRVMAFPDMPHSRRQQGYGVHA